MMERRAWGLQCGGTLGRGVLALAGIAIVLLACKQGKEDQEKPAEVQQEPASNTECKGGEVSPCQCPGGEAASRECSAAGTWKPCDCHPSPPQLSGGSELAADGLPKEIPSPGSKPPTTAEWAAVEKECTVKGSSALKCSTWMVREWLKVNCHKNHLGNPSSVDLSGAGGVEAFEFVRPNTKTSVVLQVVRSKRSTVGFQWDRGSKTLVVDWPHGAPRPDLRFE